MIAHSLRRVLGLQWALFAVALLAGLTSIGVVAMYVLEDSFIDAHLVAAEKALAGQRAPPPRVELMRLADVPAAERDRLAGLRPGALREFWLDRERYVHLRVLPPDAQGWRALSFEAQDELRVTAALRRAAPLLLALLGLLMLHAAWLASRFVRRIESAAGGLLQALDREPSSDSLRAAADAQPVLEFRRFGHALADSLDARLAALSSEENLLRFLAHELRTPLQSARLAFAALPPDPHDPPARVRLQRALLRLERASAAVLWLGEATPTTEPARLDLVASGLAQEFEPLARQRGQSIEVESDASLSLPLPLAAAEAIVSNLLLNAIQHGAPGRIAVRVGTEALEIENACGQGDLEPGFGLGLEFVRRLLARVAWRLDLQLSGQRALARILPQPH